MSAFTYRPSGLTYVVAKTRLRAFCGRIILINHGKKMVDTIAQGPRSQIGLSIMIPGRISQAARAANVIKRLYKTRPSGYFLDLCL
ncbi:hypothetical protein [Brevibacillus brevis]|uniref:Uncharacterized protein n=1 Tax=Brevibacillus brevis TaxID=1393 RepID=A0ABY9T0V7_BREBE|nr:hypothetical protein [Brevibacillus brevis]WNC12597.1 hypothetical protein RGB73_17875 [Brevibacillus brevis]